MGYAGVLKIAAGVAAMLASFWLRAASLEPWTGGATPELRAKTVAGQPFDLAALEGRTVLVNFWATWCAPCVAEMPGLQRLRDKQGIEVVAVNFQENAARITPFLEKLKIDLRVVRDHDGSLRAAWGVSVFPTTFVVAPDGRIALLAIGEVDWDDAAIAARVAAAARRTARR